MTGVVRTHEQVAARSGMREKRSVVRSTEPVRLSQNRCGVSGAETEEYIFLECNAAGQWGWIAEKCGLPIAEAIADELTGEMQ